MYKPSSRIKLARKILPIQTRDSVQWMLPKVYLAVWGSEGGSSKTGLKDQRGVLSCTSIVCRCSTEESVPATWYSKGSCTKSPLIAHDIQPPLPVLPLAFISCFFPTSDLSKTSFHRQKSVGFVIRRTTYTAEAYGAPRKFNSMLLPHTRYWRSKPVSAL